MKFRELAQWLFATSEGHFAITTACLVVCTTGFILGYQDARPAMAAVWLIFLAKLK